MLTSKAARVAVLLLSTQPGAARVIELLEEPIYLVRAAQLATSVLAACDEPLPC